MNTASTAKTGTACFAQKFRQHCTWQRIPDSISGRQSAIVWAALHAARAQGQVNSNVLMSKDAAVNDLLKMATLTYPRPMIAALLASETAAQTLVLPDLPVAFHPLPHQARRHHHQECCWYPLQYFGCVEHQWLAVQLPCCGRRFHSQQHMSPDVCPHCLPHHGQ